MSKQVKSRIKFGVFPTEIFPEYTPNQTQSVGSKNMRLRRCVKYAHAPFRNKRRMRTKLLLCVCAIMKTKTIKMFYKIINRKLFTAKFLALYYPHTLVKWLNFIKK